MDENLIRDICKYIIDNINDDVTLSIVAEEFNYNMCHVARKFKAYTGFTITEFINECRVYNTIDPLVFTDDTILNIALMHGFNNQEYYSEKFRDVIGTSPLRFRKVFSVLANKVSDSENLEELKAIREEFNELKDYQEYLKNTSVTVFSKDEERREKPKILKLQ